MFDKIYRQIEDKCLFLRLSVIFFIDFFTGSHWRNMPVPKYESESKENINTSNEGYTKTNGLGFTSSQMNFKYVQNIFT